jgi:hypothetical protein
MKIFCFILTTSILCSISFSQAKIDFDGYVVNVPAYLRLNDLQASFQNVDQNYWIDVTRLRLRPTINLSETGYIALEYEAATTYQSGILKLLAPSSGNRRQLFDLSCDILKNDRWNVLQSIDRLYYRQQVVAFDISIGRQRIAWGSGRIWNPTDLFNPLNPTTF